MLSKRLKAMCSDEPTLKKDIEELRISFIKSNYPINLFNRLFFFEKPDKPKVSLASRKIVYIGIKYFNNKSVKFAKRLAKIISKYNGILKSFHIIKQVESYFHNFQPLIIMNSDILLILLTLA